METYIFGAVFVALLLFVVNRLSGGKLYDYLYDRVYRFFR